MKRLSSTDQNNTALNNVPTPANPGDATNKTYVDDGLATKAGSTHTHAQSDVTNLETALADRVKGIVRITVSSIAPTSPATNDLWVDTT